MRVELVGLVLLDELLGPRIIRIGIENLVETRIALRFVKELHQLRHGHAFALRVAHAASKRKKKKLTNQWQSN